MQLTHNKHNYAICSESTDHMVHCQRNPALVDGTVYICTCVRVHAYVWVHGCVHAFIHTCGVCVCVRVCAQVCVCGVCVCVCSCVETGKGEASSAHISADMSLANLIGSKQVSHSQSNQSNIISHDQVKHWICTRDSRTTSSPWCHKHTNNKRFVSYYKILNTQQIVYSKPLSKQ